MKESEGAARCHLQTIRKFSPELVLHSMVANIAHVDLRAAYAVAAEVAETAVDC